MGIEYKNVKEFTSLELKELFSSVNWPSANYSERLVNAMKNSSRVVSAWEGDKLIGLINSLDDGELTAYVHYLLVNPNYQGKGIGQTLVEKMKENYITYLYFILISENKETIGFYEKCGLKVMDGAIPMVVKKI